MQRIARAVFALIVIGCGEPPSSGLDASGLDAAGLDAAGLDAAGLDAAGLDASTSDASSVDAEASDAQGAVDAHADGSVLPDATSQCSAMDVRMGRACGPTERPGPRWMWDGSACEVVFWCECVGADCDALYGTEAECEVAYGACGGAPCVRDSDCASGSEWCEGGRCVACDNSGLVCFIACGDGWSTYQRNGCTPCECAPPSACDDATDCVAGGCYAGAFCWGGCAPGDPACCRGNTCGAPGCTGPNPAGCRTTGCPRGESCDTTTGCEPSACSCTSGGWVCTDDCGGGTCIPAG